jgi:hypothetical protein
MLIAPPKKDALDESRSALKIEANPEIVYNIHYLETAQGAIYKK